MSIFDLFKSKKGAGASETLQEEDARKIAEAKARADEVAEKEAAAAESEQKTEQQALQVPKTGLFTRLKAGLKKTRGKLGDGIADVFLGKKQIDDELLEDLETVLLTADIGIDATQDILKALTDQISRKSISDPEALKESLKQILIERLSPYQNDFDTNAFKPAVILMVGVNGAGKTTTIGKLAKKLQEADRSVLLGAGDTFRAAAVEQLQVWGERNNIPVIAQETGADSASVLFDSVSAAKARGVDVVIADTAGRLHTKQNLMEELKKVVRVIKKIDDQAPHEILLVLDAGVGQNALSQAEHFIQTVSVTGLVITKLDGTAKGGVVFALANKFGLPIRFIGIGEGVDDLRPFVAEEFVNALLEGES